MTTWQSQTVPFPPGRRLVVNGLRIAFSANDMPAVDLERLIVEPGTQVALVGPSGSGKTTLAYALTGILPPGDGTVRWDEIELGRLGETGRDTWRRRNVGFIFQDFHLVPGLSPLTNVLASCYFAALRPSAAAVRRARDLLELVKVPLARDDVARLSRGEQQRVAIARALLHDPPILVADEPTASLDAAHGAEVIRLLDAAALAGRTLLTVTHDARLVERCDRVLRLEGGRLVGDDANTVERALRRGCGAAASPG